MSSTPFERSPASSPLATPHGPHLAHSARALIASSATVVGDVSLGVDTSVWYGTVVRGDVASITIGARTNLQDLTMVHPDTGEEITIGDDVTVGHRAILHMRTLGSGTLIGMGAILLARSHIGDECIIGAGALVPEGRVIPPRSVVVGTPGRIVRSVTDEEAAGLRAHAQRYVETARRHVPPRNS